MNSKHTFDELYLLDFAMVCLSLNLLYPLGVLLPIRKVYILAVGDLGNSSLRVAGYCPEEVLGRDLVGLETKVYLRVLLFQNGDKVELGDAKALGHCGR